METTMKGFLYYIPQAILGLLVLLFSLVIGDFASANIKKEKLEFASFLGLGVEILIIFFGLVFALPYLFGQQNTYTFMESLKVMTESFKYLMMGVALGVAFEVGLGLKDSIKDIKKKK